MQIKVEPSKILVLHARSISGMGGGPEKTILNTPKYLREMGYDCRCLYLCDSGSAERFKRYALARESSVEVFEDRGALDWRTAMKVIRCCSSNQKVVWHGHDYKTNLMGLIARRFYPVTLVTTLHGWVSTHTRAIRFYNNLDRFMVRFYQHVLCVSEDLYEESERLGIAENRRHLVTNGIDCDAFARAKTKAEARTSIGAPVSGVLIGAAGRLAEEKGFLQLIDVIDSLSKQHNVSLWIAGEGDLREALENKIEALGLKGRCQLLGHLESVADFFQSLDIFVLSSYREGLPNVLLEAMAYEVPVLSTRIAGIPSLIQHEKSGLLVEPNQTEEMAASLARLITDSNYRSAIGDAGRQRIVDSFSFRERMKKEARIYEILYGKDN